MANLGIVTNPLEFIKQVVEDTPNSELPEIFKPVVRIYLYYIWRGAFESRRKFLQNQIQSDLGLLCMASYKSLVAPIQLIRLGYSSDALILLRSSIERIALLGYLESNSNQIEKYNKGKTLYRVANEWAKHEWEKDATTAKWNRLYGQMSKVSHSNIEGTAGHVVADQNAIGHAFRLYMKPEEEKDNASFFEAGFIGLFFAIRVADLTAKTLFRDENFRPIPEDRDCLTYLPRADLDHSISVFQKWIEEGNQLLSKKR